jgi:hypothetical protein
MATHLGRRSHGISFSLRTCHHTAKPLQRAPVHVSSQPASINTGKVLGKRVILQARSRNPTCPMQSSTGQKWSPNRLFCTTQSCPVAMSVVTWGSLGKRHKPNQRHLGIIRKAT